MGTVDVNKSHYQQHNNDFVYNSSEEDEVASSYDLRYYQRHHLKTRRRVRAETVRSLVHKKENASLIDNVHAECVDCNDDPDFAIELKRQVLKSVKGIHEPNTVLVAVEACHISPIDVAIRRGVYHRPVPFVLGSNFVGVVHETSSETSHWRLGRRVAGLSLGGSNARYLTTTTERLFDVPKNLDASEIACIQSVFLPAFQALQHGQPRPWRYSDTSLRKKRILITEGDLPETLAILRMAHYGGAQEVYVVAERDRHKALRQMNSIPLDVHGDDWGPMVAENMDVVVDFDFALNGKAAYRALAPNGRLVWSRHPDKREKTTGHSCYANDNLWEQTKMCLLERASLYDLYESWNEHPHSFRLDLEFLLRLLAQRQIRPIIDQYIGLTGVKQAHKDLQRHSLSGSMICEPWKDDIDDVAPMHGSRSGSSSLWQAGTDSRDPRRSD